MYSCTVLCRQPCPHVAKPPLPNKKIDDCAPPHAESDSVFNQFLAVVAAAFGCIFPEQGTFLVFLLPCASGDVSEPFVYAKGAERKLQQTCHQQQPSLAAKNFCLRSCCARLLMPPKALRRSSLPPSDWV